MDIAQLLGICNLILLVCGAIGGFFAFKHAQKTKTIEIQRETIEALQQQIDAVKNQVASLKEENARQAVIIETITAALKQKGIVVTIDGEMVTFTFADGSLASTRKQRPVRKSTPDA